MGNKQHLAATPMFMIGAEAWNGLSKLNEEAGEVIQVIGKILGTGGNNLHWNIPDLRAKLIEEMGDCYAALVFVARHNGFHAEMLEQAKRKLERFERWNIEQRETGSQT